MQRALIFDLDGVLTDTVEYHFHSWQRLAADLGLAFDRAANEALLGRSRADALELFLDGRLPEADRDELQERKNRYFHESIADFGPDDLAPGALELLEAARERMVRLGLASASRNARLVCQRLGIIELFDAFADGCSGLRPKPEPDVFLWVAGALGVSPGCGTVIEDAQAGVEAARKAGFRVVGVGPPERVGGAHLILHDLGRANLDDLLQAGRR